jgi:hypothetical protein
MLAGYRNFEDYRTSHPEQRYGQAFCNYYKLRDETALFYEKNDAAAIERCALIIASYQLAA